MARKVLLIFVLCTMSISIVVFNQFFMDLKYINTFKSYVMSQLQIPFTIVENYNSNDSELIEQASDEIILTTLENLGYDHWKEYLEYIELNIYQGNVIPNSEKELIVALNLSKDLAAIAIYSPIDQQYVFKTALKDIFPIKEISFLKVPEKDYNFLVTEQLLDERFGAFFVDQFVEIYLYEKDSLSSVFKKSKFLQEIYNLQWIDPNASPNQWVKIMENNSINIYQDKRLNIKVSTLRTKLEATKQFMPEESDFKISAEIVTDESYYWSPKYSHFVLFEGIDRNLASEVAVIEDTYFWKESFLGLKSNNYKVKTRAGEVFFQEKGSIIVNIE